MKSQGNVCERGSSSPKLLASPMSVNSMPISFVPRAKNGGSAQAPPFSHNTSPNRFLFPGPTAVFLGQVSNASSLGKSQPLAWPSSSRATVPSILKHDCLLIPPFCLAPFESSTTTWTIPPILYPDFQSPSLFILWLIFCLLLAVPTLIQTYYLLIVTHRLILSLMSCSASTLKSQFSTCFSLLNSRKLVHQDPATLGRFFLSLLSFHFLHISHFLAICLLMGPSCLSYYELF